MYANVVDYATLKTPDQNDAYAGLFEGLAEVMKEQELCILTGESA